MDQAELIEVLVRARQELAQWHAEYHGDCTNGCPTLLLIAEIDNIPAQEAAQ